MNTQLPGIVVTGASGFVGRHFLEAARGKYRLFCLARRSRKEAGIPDDPNMRWSQVDVGRWETMRHVVPCVKSNGGADFVLHLAGYYDFTQKDNPEYKQTNVTGTFNVLKLAQQIGTKRFLFSSSLAACEFPNDGEYLTEESSPDADFPYAWSKREGEKMLTEFSQWFPCTIIRLAAVYSDWCEYPPLYMFLQTWLSSKWNRRILGGHGESAVPYIHVKDLNEMFLRIIRKTEKLPRLCTLLASPGSEATHHQLFSTATRYYYGQDIKPLRMPKLLAIPGVAIRQWVGDMIGKPPFERIWMMEYIDEKLRVDPSYTYEILGWKPTPRLHILRRLLFLLENMKHYSDVWQLRNEAALERVAQRPNLVIYEHMMDLREQVIEELIEYIHHKDNAQTFPNYHSMDDDMLREYITIFYHLIATTVRTRDRLLLMDYAKLITHRRYVEGFPQEELIQLVSVLEQITDEKLGAIPKLAELQQRIYDNITLPVQLILDEIEESYEMLSASDITETKEEIRDLNSANSIEINRIIRQLNDICRATVDHQLPVYSKNSNEPQS